MEIKNLFTKQAQDTYSAVTGGIKKKIKPVVDMWSELVRQNVEAVKPAIQSVADTVNTSFVEPIVKPIQQAQQKSEKIRKINTFFSEKWITIDDIKALAEEEWLDANEVISKFQRNGIKVQWMEDLQTQEDTKVQEEANKPFAVDVSPEYDEVTALSRLTGAIPKFQYSPDEWFLKTAWKMVWNLFPSAVQVAWWIGDIGLSYARNIDQWPIDAFTETSKAKIINPTIAQAYWIKDVAKEGYKEWGIIWSANKLLEKWTEFIVENPVWAIMTGKWVSGLKRGWVALKTAWTEAMKWNIGKATAWLAKSIGIGLKENIYDPIKMWVTAPITVAKLWAKGIWAIAKKTGIKAPEWVQNVSNYMAEEMLSSQWKLTKPIRKELEGKIGQSWPKFALENDLVWKDIESTADNAWAFKIEKIKQKIDAVKTFGKTETPSVAKNVAQVLKSDIESSVQKSYGKWKTQKILDENHPELASVYRLADEIINSKDIDYVKLEQLKELHDYLNPENIQYDISGKPISETRNILSAGKRQKLQQILEAEGQKRWIDIKKINKDIQWAYTLEKWLNDTVGRIANLNILWLWDTQTAVISSILWWAPWAVGWILLKKWLTSEWFVWGLAKSLYSKKNVATNNGNPSGTMTPPVTRLGRIMNNNSDTINSKVESKGITPKPKTEWVKPSPQVKPVEKTVKASEKDFTWTPLYEKKLSKDLITKAINDNKWKQVTIFLKNTQYWNPKVFEWELQWMDLQTGLDNHRVLIKKDNWILWTSGHFYENIKDIQINWKSIFDENKLHSEFADEILKRKPLSPQKTVKPKNLTPKKQSATMGDMETKKLIEEARKIGVDINKYFENVSEKSAIKMADYASDIVGKKMIKWERPMDMSELWMLSNKINKNEAWWNITTVWDIIKDSDLRKLYEKALDTPITILDERVARKWQLWGYVPMWEGRYWWHIVLFWWNKEISNNLPKSILHEAAHAIRDSKWRKLEVDYR